MTPLLHIFGCRLAKVELLLFCFFYLLEKSTKDKGDKYFSFKYIFKYISFGLGVQDPGKYSIIQFITFSRI